MKKLFTIIFILGVCLFFSCNKKDTTTNPVNTYISKTTFANIGTYTWSYDAQSRLKNIAFVSSNEAANKSYNYIVNSFDASNRIVDGLLDYVSVTEPDIRFINTYNAAGKISRVDYIDNVTGNLESRQSVTYPSANQIMLNSLTSTGAVFYCDVYTLSADLKNVVERKRYNGLNGTGTVVGTDVYSNFSTIKNYTSLYPIGYAAGPSSENVYGTDTYTPASGAVSTFTYTYESNADGYATKRTSASGAINTFEFIKK